MDIIFVNGQTFWEGTKLFSKKWCRSEKKRNYGRRTWIVQWNEKPLFFKNEQTKKTKRFEIYLEKNESFFAEQTNFPKDFEKNYIFFQTTDLLEHK